MGAGSSAGLKALLANKPFVALNSSNQNVYPDWLRSGLDVEEIEYVLNNQPRNKIQNFLDANVGENPYNATERFYNKLKEII